MKRRQFLQQAAAVAWLASLTHSTRAFAKSVYQQITMRYLRPPGSLEEEDFLAACIRCGQCGEACPNRCIKYFDVTDSLSKAGTPYIIPREKACILCMKCGDVCPTGAIKPVRRDVDEILSEVDMGVARVDEQLCLSYQGKSCGVCYRACPLPDIAIRTGFMEQPHVLDQCVGCGLCERSCIQLPQAIKVIPRHTIPRNSLPDQSVPA